MPRERVHTSGAERQRSYRKRRSEPIVTPDDEGSVTQDGNVTPQEPIVTVESSHPIPAGGGIVTPGSKRNATPMTLGQFYDFVSRCTERDPAVLGKLATTNPEIQMRLEALERWIHQAARTCRDTLSHT